jgi:pimeloyl-ACP methyl ester carboxylesterase
MGDFANLNGITMHFEVGGAGDPLLLLHGGSGCLENWAYAGRGAFEDKYRLILPDARGHGRTSNPGRTITHRQCALDTLALMDHLGIGRARAIGLSMGGNILLHLATIAPDRIEAMVVVSATMYFPEEARTAMAAVPEPDRQPPQEWEVMRRRHKLGDAQIVAIWDWMRGMQASHDDMNFTPPSLSRVSARTLVVYGDRDPLYPVEMGLALYRAIPKSALWVVPGGGHGPVFADAAPRFAETALSFFGAAT